MSSAASRIKLKSAFKKMMEAFNKIEDRWNTNYLYSVQVLDLISKHHMYNSVYMYIPQPDVPTALLNQQLRNDTDIKAYFCFHT